MWFLNNLNKLYNKYIIIYNKFSPDKHTTNLQSVNNYIKVLDQFLLKEIKEKPKAIPLNSSISYLIYKQKQKIDMNTIIAYKYSYKDLEKIFNKEKINYIGLDKIFNFKFHTNLYEEACQLMHYYNKKKKLKNKLLEKIVIRLQNKLFNSIIIQIKKKTEYKLFDENLIYKDLLEIISFNNKNLLKLYIKLIEETYLNLVSYYKNNMKTLNYYSLKNKKFKLFILTGYKDFAILKQFKIFEYLPYVCFIIIGNKGQLSAKHSGFTIVTE